MNARQLRSTIMFAMALLWASVCLASGGKVSYPDGQPVVGAQVNVQIKDVDKFKVTTDAKGRFSLPTMDFLDALVQIKAPDGKDYATVSLPVALFQAGEISVVLQPKR